MDTYWRKIKRDSQYQLKEVLDWIAHLEHLQAVLREFDSAATPNDEIMIRYFWEGLRPSIRAQLDARGRELDSWEEAIEKAIDAEAKASLQPPSILREMDQRCPQGNRLAYTTVAKFQASTRDPRNKSSAPSTWHP